MQREQERRQGWKKKKAAGGTETEGFSSDPEGFMERRLCSTRVEEDGAGNRRLKNLNLYLDLSKEKGCKMCRIRRIRLGPGAGGGPGEFHDAAAHTEGARGT